jgi:hypothetical protein
VEVARFGGEHEWLCEAPLDPCEVLRGDVVVAPLWSRDCMTCVVVAESDEGCAGVEGCDGGNGSGGQGAVVVEDDVKKNVKKMMMICGPPFIEYDGA